MTQRILVGITGATGAVFGVRILEMLSSADVETHLVVSRWGERTLAHETGMAVSDVGALADHWYRSYDMGAAVSSGSFLMDGMVVAPCSVRTLAAIAHGVGDHLVHRAADVILKERRKLVLLVRESPLHELHLESMLALSRMGVIIFPPVPAFYNHPKSLDEMVSHVAARVLDQIDVDVGHDGRWDGQLIDGGVSVDPDADH